MSVGEDEGFPVVLSTVLGGGGGDLGTHPRKKFET